MPKPIFFYTMSPKIRTFESMVVGGAVASCFNQLASVPAAQRGRGSSPATVASQGPGLDLLIQ